jgi:hypothetical protein
VAFSIFVKRKTAKTEKLPFKSYTLLNRPPIPFNWRNSFQSTTPALFSDDHSNLYDHIHFKSYIKQQVLFLLTYMFTPRPLNIKKQRRDYLPPFCQSQPLPHTPHHPA